MEKLAILILMLGIVGVVAWRLRSSPKQTEYGSETAEAQDKPDPYHCVSIRSPKGACEAAKQLMGKRFLSREAPPPLPLLNCTAKYCQCRYAHHESRRVDGGDRRAPFKDEHGTGPELRSASDRRRS